jgi:hypothetical protein
MYDLYTFDETLEDAQRTYELVGGAYTRIFDRIGAPFVKVLSAVCCLLSAVCCLLSTVCCLLSTVCCLLPAVAFCCLLSTICLSLPIFFTL